MGGMIRVGRAIAVLNSLKTIESVFFFFFFVFVCCFFFFFFFFFGFFFFFFFFFVCLCVCVFFSCFQRLPLFRISLSTGIK